MVQVLYCIIAMMLLAVSMLNVNVKIHGNQGRMMANELSLGMTSVGAEVLNELAKYPYDPVALPITASPVLGNPNALRDANTFGLDPDGDPVACDPDASFSACQYLIDFHGKTFTRTQTRTFQGTTHTVTYNATVNIEYVTNTAPHTPTTSKTFARRAVVTVSTPSLYLSDPTDLLKVSMSRVYTYPNL